MQPYGRPRDAECGDDGADGIADGRADRPEPRLELVDGGRIAPGARPVEIASELGRVGDRPGSEPLEVPVGSGTAPSARKTLPITDPWWGTR